MADDYSDRLMDAAGEGMSASDARRFAGSGRSLRFLGELREESKPENDEPETEETE